MKSGSITLLIGPAFAEKTTELIRHINRYRVKNHKICLVIPENSKEIKNNKYDFIQERIIVTNQITPIISNKLFQDSDVIAIDDLHLFVDCLEVLPIIANTFQKKIVCAGLDNNFNRECYENVINLIPKCEEVKKLSAFCAIQCDGSPAIYTKKLDNNEFIAVSRRSFLERDKSGFLHIITGPMFSGKTTELIRIANKYVSIHKKIVAINYSKDTRYDPDGNIFSHDKQKFKKTLALDDLDDLITNHNDLIQESDVILIDEIQFFKNALKNIKLLVEEYNKIVIVSGLDGDYLQKPFGDICKLIAFSDKLTRLTAVCSLSPDYRDAPFSRRIVKSEQTEFIGADDSYIAVSRYIYNLPHNSIIEKLVQKEDPHESSI